MHTHVWTRWTARLALPCRLWLCCCRFYVWNWSFTIGSLRMILDAEDDLLCRAESMIPDKIKWFKSVLVPLRGIIWCNVTSHVEYEKLIRAWKVHVKFLEYGPLTICCRFELSFKFPWFLSRHCTLIPWSVACTHLAVFGSGIRGNKLLFILLFPNIIFGVREQ